MRERRATSRAHLALLIVGFVVAITAFGCGVRADGAPPPIRPGTACARCGMGIEDAKFAATRKVEKTWRAYDAIECLIADRAGAAGGPAWVADYETKALLPESAAWVLHGDFPSPMGGGLAAFAERAMADSLAVLTHGTVGRLSAFPPVDDRP